MTKDLLYIAGMSDDSMYTGGAALQTVRHTMVMTERETCTSPGKDMTDMRQRAVVPETDMIQTETTVITDTKERTGLASRRDKVIKFLFDPYS